jgi:hypothetical protein
MWTYMTAYRRSGDQQLGHFEDPIVLAEHGAPRDSQGAPRTVADRVHAERAILIEAFEVVMPDRLSQAVVSVNDHIGPVNLCECGLLAPDESCRRAQRKRAAPKSGPKYREETPKKGTTWQRQSPCCNAQNSVDQDRYKQ